ncbi:unnamed protein product [Ectocarpus sp. CCAP 1310/34]|nr:unnamed protein product [Ectocarpus sp. CCAP 1310/34]
MDQEGRVLCRDGKKKVYNAMAAIKDHLYSSPEDAANFLATLQSEPGMFVEREFDSIGRLENVFWATVDQQNKIARYGACIQMDTTVFMNRYGCPLLFIVGVDDENRSCILAQCLLRSECTETFKWILTSWDGASGDRRPKVFLTDGEKAMTAALRGWKTTLHLYCLWHIFKNVLKNCASSFPDADERKGMLGLFRSATYATPEAFNKHSADLERTIAGKECAKYMQDLIELGTRAIAAERPFQAAHLDKFFGPVKVELERVGASQFCQRDSCEHGERCCVSINDLCAEIKGRSRILASYDTALRRHLAPVGEYIAATTGRMDVPDGLNKSGESFQHSGRCRVSFNDLCAEIKGRSRILASYDTALRRHLAPVGEYIAATTGRMDVPDGLNKSGESFQHSGRCRVSFNDLCAEIRAVSYKRLFMPPPYGATVPRGGAYLGNHWSDGRSRWLERRLRSVVNQHTSSTEARPLYHSASALVHQLFYVLFFYAPVSVLVNVPHRTRRPGDHEPQLPSVEVLPPERCFDVRQATGQPHLKIRLLQAEVVETLLYGCASWSLSVEHYTKLNGTHRQFLTRCIGWSKRKRSDRPLSYAQALIQAGCKETIEATVRKRRLCFAGFVMRMEDSRLPKRMLLGAMAGGVGYRGGQESDWVPRLGEDLVAFNMRDEKEGGKWKESAKDPEVWYDKVEDGAAWFMRKWHRQEVFVVAVAVAAASAATAAAVAGAAMTAATTAAVAATARRISRRSVDQRPGGSPISTSRRNSPAAALGNPRRNPRYESPPSPTSAEALLASVASLPDSSTEEFTRWMLSAVLHVAEGLEARVVRELLSERAQEAHAARQEAEDFLLGTVDLMLNSPDAFETALTLQYHRRKLMNLLE